MTELKATERAYQKYKEIVNGSKKELDELFSDIGSDKISVADLNKFNVRGGENFYFKKCKNVYAIILTEEQNLWFLVDILTGIEFQDVKKSSSSHP